MVYTGVVWVQTCFYKLCHHTVSRNRFNSSFCWNVSGRKFIFFKSLMKVWPFLLITVQQCLEDWLKRILHRAELRILSAIWQISFLFSACVHKTVNPTNMSEQVITPFKVRAKVGKQVDYDKLVDQFGAANISTSLI